jgi:uncharacterized FlaG/YvyC family protein
MKITVQFDDLAEFEDNFKNNEQQAQAIERLEHKLDNINSQLAAINDHIRILYTKEKG